MAISTISDRWLSRGSNLWTFAAPLVPGTLGAIVTGYLSTGVRWISQWGAFGWWCTALLGGILTSAIYLGGGIARGRWADAKAKDKWSREVDAIDPMAPNFDRKRFRITDIAHPFSNRVVSKNFSDCDILGPGSIALVGTGTANQVSFMGCAFVIVRDDVPVPNLTVFDSCNFTRGTIWNCIVFVSQDHWNLLQQGIPGAFAITYERPT